MTETPSKTLTFPDRSDMSTEELELGAAFAPKFLDDGTIPAITTDAETGAVLMFAYMNRYSLSLTIQSGIAHYWSRSRGKLWKKGETSGNLQEIVELKTDCDQDVILIRVNVQGKGASCHQGYQSCFYRSMKTVGDASAEPELEITENGPLFNPEEVYK